LTQSDSNDEPGRRDKNFGYKQQIMGTLAGWQRRGSSFLHNVLAHAQQFLVCCAVEEKIGKKKTLKN
jgi:hypothetical protein